MMSTCVLVLLGLLTDVVISTADNKLDNRQDEDNQVLNVRESRNIGTLINLLNREYQFHMPMSDTCFIRGKMHYVTFDGLNYNLIARCRYKLVHDSHSTVDITVNNDPHMTHSTPPRRSVNIKADGKEVHLGNKLENKMFNVKIGGSLVNLPYDGVPRIKQVGRYVMVETSDGVFVTFDGSQDISITVPKAFKSTPRLSGLCGNLDGNPNNDLVDYSGTSVTPEEFSLAYRENLQNCEETTTLKNLLYLPDKNPDAAYLNADRICDVINTEPFKACHLVFNPKNYKVMCMQDVLVCNTDKFDDCFCSSLSLYARTCHDAGVDLEWRREELCPITCESNKVYAECGSACPKLCDNIVDGTCLHDCVDGCHCPTGMHWDPKPAHCVPLSQCSCYHNGIPYLSGTVKYGKCEKCTCSGGQFQCTSADCAIK